MAPACPCSASLSPRALSAFAPKAGAQCGSSARWDPCGGPPVRAVPRVERRGRLIHELFVRATRRCPGRRRVDKSSPQNKSFEIPKQLVWEAYKKVKANKGAAGVDGQSIEDFEKDLKNNLY